MLKKTFCFFIFFPLLSSALETQGSNPPVAAPQTKISTEDSKQKDWSLGANMAIPFRGFTIQSGESAATSSDNLGNVSYSPPASLEGQIRLSYKFLGFSYQGTLASADLDDSAQSKKSINNEYRFDFFINNNLFELVTQEIKGMSTSQSLTKDSPSKKIAREDMKYSDLRARWIYGLPLYGSENSNTLTNYYGSAKIDTSKDLSIDLLFSAELMSQRLYAKIPFIPVERQPEFGSGSQLNEVASNGLGAGLGFGLTARMHKESYFGFGGLLGGNYNLSKAKYLSGENKNISGFGNYMNARLSILWDLDEKREQTFSFKLNVDSWKIPAKEESISSTNAAFTMAYSLMF